MAIKTKDTENLTKQNIERVIELLVAEKPITKKAACEILNISYNTTRLDKIINDFKDKEAERSRKRKEKAGKPTTEAEYDFIASEYLSGNSVSNISERLFRSTDIINTAIEAMGLPKRSSSFNYRTPELIPEQAVLTEFTIGEKVWSARYETLCTIEKLVQTHNVFGPVYRIWLLGNQEYANQPACELASLRHLTKFGVKI